MNNLGKSWRTVSISAGLSWLMKLLLLGITPYQIYNGEYLYALATFIAFIVSLIPSVVERNYRITLPFELDLLFTLMVFLHSFVGEALDMYSKFELFDKALHLYGGIVIAMLGFLVVYTLHYTRKVKLSLPLVGFFTISFTMAVGAMWEIGEFTADKLLDSHAQNGLDDTMFDMIVDLIGGVVVSVLGMVYVRFSHPDERIRLARPLGEVFGAGARLDRMRKRLKRGKKGNGREAELP